MRVVPPSISFAVATIVPALIFRYRRAVRGDSFREERARKPVGVMAENGLFLDDETIAQNGHVLVPAMHRAAPQAEDRRAGILFRDPPPFLPPVTHDAADVAVRIGAE